MKITKKNGHTSLYDDEKVVNSILKANAEVPQEAISAAVAAAMADEVFARLTRENEILTTQDVRSCVQALLLERGLPRTAQRYMEFQK